MKVFLTAVGLTFMCFFLPAFYAAALVLLANIFGDAVFIHAALFAVFTLLCLYSIMKFIKVMPYQEEKTDGTEKKDNDW